MKHRREVFLIAFALAALLTSASAQSERTWTSAAGRTFPADKHGLIYQLFIGNEVSTKKEPLHPLFKV